MKKALRRWLLSVESRLRKFCFPPADPIPELRQQNQFLTQKLAELAESQAMQEATGAYMTMVGELMEAKQMAGAGPWTVNPATAKRTDAILASAAECASPIRKVREAAIARLREGFESAQGAFGDIELALQNIEWRREINISWMEFSRWGIQQIMLICRLYYIKNPIVRRLIDVSAAYVFARGVEITTSDEAANDEIKDFLQRNKSVFGQIALVESEKRKDYDGNLFWCMFADKTDTGKMNVRLIDATEVQEIVTNPEDSDTPWYYLRTWTQKDFDPTTGNTSTVTQNRWYPALRYNPPVKPDTMRSFPVEWDFPVYHRKCGAVGKWAFGCPRAFPMMDWARESRRLLEACASIKQSLMQIALVWKTKGGQQALEGIKQQVGTTVGPNSNLWDSNPPAVPGASVAMGTGTSVEAFKTQGAGGNPDDVRQYKLMCCMVAGVPETFLADVSTGNLATATSLDRPTETIFLEKQEAWREDLVVIVGYMLEVASRATNNKLQESIGMGNKVRIIECARKRGPRGEVVYEAFKEKSNDIEIQVNFPAIREGDIPALVDATIKAGTLGAAGGQVLGIDEKELVKKLYDLVGIEHGDEIAEQQYPSDTYVTDRTSEMDLPSAIQSVVDAITLGNRAGLPVGIDLKEGVKKLYELLGIPEGDAIADKQFPDGEYDPDRTKEIMPEPAKVQIKADIGQPIVTPAGEEPPQPPPTPPQLAEALRRLHEATREPARRREKVGV
jgi:hypothetical protein